MKKYVITVSDEMSERMKNQASTMDFTVNNWIKMAVANELKTAEVTKSMPDMLKYVNQANV